MIAFFHVVSVAGCLIVAGILVVMLVMFPDQFKPTERLGMGLVGATMILSIGPVMMPVTDVTPFSDWSGSLLRLGLFLANFGRLKRLIRHHKANTRANDSAYQHLKGRGRL